jgi:HD superfamily phosphohydrolase
MHIATLIAEQLKKQRDFFTGDDRLIRVLRFAALLHDMGHVPFGHTFEDEMPIIPKHDDPSDGDTPSRMDTTVSEVLYESGNGDFVKDVLQVLRAIAASKDDAKLYSLTENGTAINPDYLVLADIVGNTICADLLDYLRRDHMMTGIRATFDDRIFRYFAVGEHTAGELCRKRLIIRLVKNGRFRGDCLADLLDILKMRYNLSDKVLFHPQKCSADAMLIKAVAQNNLTVADLLKHSDEGLLERLADQPLVKMIRSRNLFKSVFRCGPDEISTFDRVRTKENFIEQLHRRYDLRTEIEAEVESSLGLPKGESSVLVFCPQSKMTLKPVRVLVQWKDGTIRRLNSITEADDPLTYKQIKVLQDIYPRLWKLYLFVRPNLRSRGERIQHRFREALKRFAGMSATCEPSLQSYLEDGCSEFQVGSLIDEALDNRPAYRNLSAQEQITVSSKCHDRLPPDSQDDRFTEPEVRVLQSRKQDTALNAAISQIVDSVLSEWTASGAQGSLPLGK